MGQQDQDVTQGLEKLLGRKVTVAAPAEQPKPVEAPVPKVTPAPKETQNQGVTQGLEKLLGRKVTVASQPNISATSSTPAPAQEKWYDNQYFEMAKIAKQMVMNPLAMTDEEWQGKQKDIRNYIESKTGKGFWGGAAIGTADTALEFTSPFQVALLAGTFGESALVRTAAKVGGEAAIPVARTMAKLMQGYFALNMAKGAAVGTKESISAALNGDWETASEMGVTALVSGAMLYGIGSHELAQHQVRSDLEKVAREKFGQPEGVVGQTFKSVFDSLDPYKQAIVIDETVKRSPEYQAILKTVEDQDEAAKTHSKKTHEQRLKNYYGAAIGQSWNPNAAERAIRKIHADRSELRARQQESAQLDAIREAVEKNKKAEAVKREQIISDNTAAQQRNEKARTERENEVPRPQVTETVPKTVVDGEVMYGPVTHLERPAHIGIEPVENGLRVFIQEKDGTKQYLNSSGYFGGEEAAASVPDIETADTLARIQAVKTTVGDDVEKDTHLDDVTQQLVGEQISARHAQDVTGIGGGGDRLPDEHDAAHGEGVEGPFSNGIPQYLRDFDEEYDRRGFPEEKKDAARAQAEASAWELTNENLNMLTRSGDRIVDRRGVVWELGADGLLHGSNGEKLPFKKDGLYSNVAMSLAAHGRVQYGSMSREERLTREERDKSAQRAVASIDQELMATGAEPIPAEKLARVMDYSNRRRRERAERPEPQEGEQGPAPDTEQSLVNLLTQVGDAGWANNPEYAAGRLQEEADREGVPVESLVRQKLSGSKDPLAKIAQLQPGNTVKDARWAKRTWTVGERKNGEKYLFSGGAQHDLDLFNPSQTVRDIVGKGDSITFNAPEQLEEAAYKPTWVENNQKAAQGVKDRAGIPTQEPRTKEEATENVHATKGREESIVSEVTRATAEIMDVTANTTEEDTEKKIQAAKEATDTLHLAVQQAADAAGKAAPKGDYPSGVQIPIVSRGRPTEIGTEAESHPAQYALVDIEAPVVSHRWNGQNIEENEEYVPRGMQYRPFDEKKTLKTIGEAEPSSFRYSHYLDLTRGPERGPAIIDSIGRVVGGNTRLLRMKKWLENISRSADPEVQMALFREEVRKFAESIGISRIPDDGRIYIPVRILNKPIETIEESVRLGRLFNDDSSDKVSDGVEGLSNGKLLMEADQRERANGEDGILAEIGARISDGKVSSMRSAIDADPTWWARKAKEYLHIPDVLDEKWFKGSGEDRVLTPDGKNKFILAMIGSHFKDTASAGLLEGTSAEDSLVRAIGTATALRAHEGRDLNEKITEAVAAAAKTRRFRDSGDNPIPAWNHVYANGVSNGSGLSKDDEPSRVSQAIYVALLDSKTTRLNSALKEMIPGKPGMDVLFAPKVEGEELHSPADYFNVAFKPELEKIAKSQGKKFEPVTQDEFDAALQNRTWIPREEKEPAPQQEVKSEEVIPKSGIEPPPVEPKVEKGIKPPPKSRSEREIAKDGLLDQVRNQGYVDRSGLRTFLETDPVTRENAPWIMKNFKWVADAIWEQEKPEGVEKKNALDWLLERRKILGTIERDNYHEKGRGRTEWDALGRAHVYLHKEADATTAVHELWHVFLPLLSDEDIRALNTIKGDTKAIWDGKDRSELVGEAFHEFSERAIGGIEKFHRDENPKMFFAETGKVLAKIKAMFQSVYKKWREDPLRPFILTEDAKGVLDRIFHVEGIDPTDEFKTETDEAKKAQKRIKKSSEILSPLEEIGKEIGASGKPETFVSGKPLDDAGEPIRIRKSVAFIFDSPDKAFNAFLHVRDGIDRGDKRTDGVDYVQMGDGRYAVRINVSKMPDRGTAYQSLPSESRGEKGVRLEKMKRELLALPRNKILDKQFLQMQVENLENEIGSEYGAEELSPKTDPELTKKVMEEKKNERANRVREGTHAAAGIQKPPTVDRVSREAELGVSRHGAARTAGGAGGRDGIDRVEPIGMLPLRATNEESVGKTSADAPETRETWEKRLAEAGMPQTAPLPTWALDPRTARILDDERYPGQTVTTQVAMSALQRGDGVVVGNATGTGKGYVAMGIAYEFGKDHEAGDKPLILYMTKNGPLIDKTKDGPANAFGVDLKKDTPEFGVKNGTYAVSYQAALRNPVYQNIKWDLVISDEAGEARNWFKKAKSKRGINQGQMLMAIMQNARKGVYMSATPFHSPMEYGYLEKLNLWPKGKFNEWVAKNFDTYVRGDEIVGKLNPQKQARFRQQLIERGQMITQAVSYEGFNAHFGVVPITNSMKRGLSAVSTLMERARTHSQLFKGPSSKSIAAYEAGFTKAFLEREMLPQAIEQAKNLREKGYDVIIASPTTDEDLFRRKRNGEPTVFQQLDDSMNGQLGRLLPRLPNVYDTLRGEFGDEIGNYSGVHQTDSGREDVRKAFQDGKTHMVYMSIPAGGLGADWHDMSGTRPRAMIVLGPPYSGVMLEQLLGRTWRYGVKSDAHVIFLGTDAGPQVRLMKTIVAPRMRSLRAAVHGIKDSLATAMENYSGEEKDRARQDTMAYAIGNAVEVKAADYGIRHPGRVVGISSWDSLELPPATEAMNKGMKFGKDVIGGDWTTLYQEKEKPFSQPPTAKDARAGRAINEIADAAAKNPSIPKGTIALGAVHAAEVTDASPEGIDPAKAGSYAMRASLEGDGFTYNQETGEWEAPFGVVAKMMGRDTSNIDERDAKYTKLTLGMNFMQRAISAARGIGAEEKVRDVFRIKRSYQQEKEGHAGKLQTRLLEIFTGNGLHIHDAGVVEEKVRDWIGRPPSDDVRKVIDVVEGRVALSDPKINKAAEELRQWFADARQLMEDSNVHRADGSTFKDVPENPKYVNHITDWDMELTDPKTGEKKKLIQIVGDHTLDDVAKLRYFEKTRQDLGASVESMRGWLEKLREDRRRRLKRPKNANVTASRELNHPFYRKDFAALLQYSEQVASSVALEKTMGHDMSKVGGLIAKVPSSMLRKELKDDMDMLFEHEDWSTFMGKTVRRMQGFEAVTKLGLSPISVMTHSIHTSLTVGMKNWATGIARTILHPDIRREKYYHGVVMMKMNPAFIEGSRRGFTGKFFDVIGFSNIVRFNRMAISEMGRAYLEQDALSDLRRGGDREETARRLLKNRFLMSDDEIDRAIANNKWDEASLYKGERSFANATAFSESSEEMPRSARMSMASDKSETAKNHAAAARGAWMLQSYNVKTYSLLKEALFDEVIQHRNYRPLIPFFLLYPAAGFVLMNLKAAVVSGAGRTMEKIGGKEHTRDRWDRLLEEYHDIEKHPWAAPLRLYLDSLAFGMANERIRRWTDMAMLAVEGKQKELEGNLLYFAEDEQDQLMGSMYSDIVKATLEMPSKAAYVYLHTKNPRKKLKAAGRDFAREAEDLAWPLRTIPKVNEWDGTKKIHPPPK